jgi:hypothetical protein
VYTGDGWTGHPVVRDHVRLCYALPGCRDNPALGAAHSRFTAEHRSRFLAALRFADRERLVAQRIAYDKGRRPHSSLGHRAPLTFLASLSADG